MYSFNLFVIFMFHSLDYTENLIRKNEGIMIVAEFLLTIDYTHF